MFVFFFFFVLYIKLAVFSVTQKGIVAGLRAGLWKGTDRVVIERRMKVRLVGVRRLEKPEK